MGAAPVTIKIQRNKKPKEVDAPQSPSLCSEEDELDIVALAVTSEFQPADDNFYYRVLRNKKFVYESGVVKYLDDDHGEQGVLRALMRVLPRLPAN